MQISFQKYQGTGNDFIVIDDRCLDFPDDQNIINRMCHRRLGIGADGLILLRNHSVYDYEMVYYNADGRLSSLCGNGSRCLIHFAHRLGLIHDSTQFWAIDGVHEGNFDGDSISVMLKQHSPILKIDQNKFRIDTGSPHYIEFVPTFNDYDFVETARSIRYQPAYMDDGGINVNHVVYDANIVKMRTYERGVEDETMSCGTGAVAVAIACVNNYQASFPILIQTAGGDLQINRTGKPDCFFLTGPVQHVFEGSINL